MYLSFFGFQRPPFDLVPDPDFLFLGETHDSALANLVLGIESGKGFVAITGPVGTGKTTVLRALLRRVDPSRKVCFLSQPEFAVSDLLRSVLGGFGAPTKSTDVVELRENIRTFLEQQEAPGILIVDEAHLVSEDALEQIRLLSNLENEKRKLLQIILSGQPELQGVLSSPRLRPLTQRIEMFYEIRPLDEEETRGYVERRVRIAGNPDGLRIDDRAYGAIHRWTGGIPRLINILSERTLITAYVSETRKVNAAIVDEAYRDLGSVTHSVMPGSDQEPPPPPPAPPAPRRQVEVPVQIPPAVASAPITEIPVAPENPDPPRVERLASPIMFRPPRRTEDRATMPSAPVAQAATARSDVVDLMRMDDPPLLAAEIRPLPPRTPKPPRPNPFHGSGDRWMAAVGIFSIVMLSVVSLGSRWASSSADSPVPVPVPVAAAEPVDAETAIDAASFVAAESPTSPAPHVSRIAADVPESRGSVAEPSLVPGAFTVHVASFRELERARSFAGTLRSETGEAVRISPSEVESGLWYRVLLGEYDSQSDALARRARLRQTHEFPFLRVVPMVHPEELEG